MELPTLTLLFFLFCLSPFPRATTTSTSPSRARALSAWPSCIRSSGVDGPAPGPGRQPEQVRAAVVFEHLGRRAEMKRKRQGVEAYMKRSGDAAGPSPSASTAIISKPGVWPWYEKLAWAALPRSTRCCKARRRPHRGRQPPRHLGLPPRWIWATSGTSSPTRTASPSTPSLKVDERSYDSHRSGRASGRYRHGRRHPVAVPRSRKASRVFVTALGHNAEMYKDPTLSGAPWWGGIY